jgi:hypothetical protein
MDSRSMPYVNIPRKVVFCSTSRIRSKTQRIARFRLGPREKRNVVTNHPRQNLRGSVRIIFMVSERVLDTVASLATQLNGTNQHEMQPGLQLREGLDKKYI